ncbi:bifunctional phosphopantothenoylcysteine decarboxylase/phosphopantothenate--cysteine ligase CoaBC [Picrophilus oshimae]|uniref:Coenzyme A biosynthesis bifunctional protein CoaBC n=1 Tax=Picrophilus torridus (strain ATCC 700027 / DSM 9790 / JCM 10055 / NBRC 100828 / KAW 2/3) TaxID=1122961 RepID=Q6KZX7_PICTO|nr:bifunctional phosphopantothenoylcysteine decarboxylase/phosphopantothenate--cysteine ligase CoaBC [Picrophilus oshimae]AAT43725.1 DNA/pantothenate metabolism flavoprotein [Picrophilus oshimae DSM 9789]
MLTGEKTRFAGMLKGRKIVVATSASISIYRVPDLVRDLRREGADVKVAMSDASQKMVSPEVMKWASGHDVVTDITGNIEHITLFDSDTLLLLAPATYDTIGKMASGIADNIPSLFFSYALKATGHIVIVPAMHRNMMENRINLENIEKLKNLGCLIVEPEYDEEKAKIADNDRIIDYVCRSFYGEKLKNKNILIIGGRSELSIDPVRFISNRSTGYTGYWLARMSFRLGADQIVYVGNSNYRMPNYVNFIQRTNLREIIIEVNTVINVYKFDIIVMCMAVLDFDIKEEKEKITSSEKHVIELEPRNKLRNRIRQMSPSSILVLFELEGDLKYNDEKFKDSRPDMVIVNSYKNSAFGESSQEYIIVSGNNKENINAEKSVLSRIILERASSINKSSDFIL